MKIKSNLSIIIIIMFAFVAIFGNKAYAAESYDQLPSKSNVDIKKSWNINFSFDVDKASVENNHDILVIDEEGTYISVKRKIVDNKTVGVSPTYGYEYDKTYTLIIRDSVKSTSGNKLSKEIRMKFTTKANPNGNTDNGNSEPNKFTVALDAGRAGNDVGNEVGPTGVLGKDINLSVALKAGTILESNGFNVVYTRTSDDVSWTSSESVASRSKIVNDSNADVLVSIHTNSWSKTASGYETYYLNSSTNAKKLATNIQSEMMKKTDLPNRGITSNELKTLSSVNAVAVYTNLGFISNPKDEKVLASTEFQQSSAEAIANAVMNYFNVENETTIKAVDDLNVILYKGEKYTLPTKVDALMSDNSHQQVTVQWDKKVVDTSKSGTFYFSGTVGGYSKKVNLKVVVNNDATNIKTVCIDPARGGAVYGAVGKSGLQEKSVNLSVALKVGELLEQKGINVVYTRNSDSLNWDNTNMDTDIENRTKIANDANADLFISIHVNSATINTAKGIETYYLNGDNESNSIANEVQNSLIALTGANNRGLKSSDYRTLQGLDGTGIFVYIGFMTNSSDEANLGSESYRQKCAEGIANAIAAGGVTKPEPDPDDGNGLPIDDTTSLSKVNDFSIKVNQGQAFSLPKYVEARNSKGESVRTSVLWNKGSVSTTEAGMYIVTGRTKVSNKMVTMAVMVMPSNKKPYKIAIDPGHGGYDPGAIGNNGVKEKNVTLAVSLKLGNILVKNGLDVVFTRISDNVPWPSNKSLELRMRCDISNDANSDYFISIHANSMGSLTSVTGVETFYYRDSNDSVGFATNVQNELYKGIGSANRGVKGAGLYVTKYTNAPAILTELEFLSNPTKELKLNDPAFQLLCAESISKGILKTID